MGCMCGGGDTHSSDRGCGSCGFQQAAEDNDPVIKTPHPVFFPSLGGLDVSDHVPRVRERGDTQCDQKGKGPPRAKRNHEQDM